MQGKKFDEGKRDWHSMPLEILEPLVEVFEAGIRKGYGRFNCLEEFDKPDSRFFSATMRHLKDSQIDPLARDEETGCYHLAQTAFNALMRLYHCKRTHNLETLGNIKQREKDQAVRWVEAQGRWRGDKHGFDI